jgi:hypothetical protein
MAACLSIWFGHVPCQEKGIKLFLKLGGKFVGNLDLPSKSLSPFQQVRDLQRQASRLCPHTTRSYEDIVLFVQNVRVGPPGMAYSDDLDEEASLQVQSLLHGCTSLAMMYDESDEYARNVLKQFYVWVDPGFDRASIGTRDVSAPKEVAYLAKRGVTHWSFMNWYVPLHPRVHHDVAFLSKHRVQSLAFYVARPTNWRDCNFNQLVVCDTSIDCQTFQRLDAVKDLTLNDFARLLPPTKDAVFNWKGLRNFPNLATLRVRCYLSVQNAQALVAELAGMQHLKNFYFNGKAPPLLLENLQEVSHLASVVVNLQSSDYNDENDARHLMRFAKYGKHVAIAASILLGIYLLKTGLQPRQPRQP